MVSMNVFVKPIETIKTTNCNGENIPKKKAELETKKIATKFVWIPGMRPVKIPKSIPINSAMSNSNSICFFILIFFIIFSKGL